MPPRKTNDPKKLLLFLLKEYAGHLEWQISNSYVHQEETKTNNIKRLEDAKKAALWLKTL